MWPTAQEAVKESKRLTQRRRGGAKRRKVELVSFLCAFGLPLRLCMNAFLRPRNYFTPSKPWDTASEQLAQPRQGRHQVGTGHCPTLSADGCRPFQGSETDLHASFPMACAVGHMMSRYAGFQAIGAYSGANGVGPAARFFSGLWAGNWKGGVQQAAEDLPEYQVLRCAQICIDRPHFLG